MKIIANQKLTVTSAPHMLDAMDTRKTMIYVVLAMLPALVTSVYVFGPRALTLTIMCVVFCVGFEYIYNLIIKREQSIGDYSAVVTGILISFNVPSKLPYTTAAIGCFIAIVIVKQLFGGIGKNIVNPAITARVVLLVSFPVEMTTWPLPRNLVTADAVTGATPLGILAGNEGVMPSNIDLFLGNVGGSLGEVSGVALLIGFAFLVYKKVVSLLIPVCYMGTVIIFALLVPGQDPIFHLFAGGLILGACFMATDYVTTPMLTSGKIIFGIGCGILTMAIRLYGAYPEGVSFAILLMNIVTPLIDNFTMNRAIGGVKKNEQQV